MKRVIPRAAALLGTLTIGLFLAGVFYRNKSVEIEPVGLPHPVLQSQPSDDRVSLSLCELAAQPLTYRGKEVVVEASHIGLLSSQRFSIVSKCSPESVSASITLVSKSKLPERLLLQLSELMYRRRESIDAASDKVIVTGIVEVRAAGGEDFDIVASDVETVVAPLAAGVPTH